MNLDLNIIIGNYFLYSLSKYYPECFCREGLKSYYTVIETNSIIIL